MKSKVRLLFAITSAGVAFQVSGCAIVAPDAGSYQALTFVRSIIVNLFSWGLGQAF